MCIVGTSSIGWMEVLESWGGSLEAMVVDIPDLYKDIRHLLNPMPTITPDKALLLPPLGPWDGCLFAKVSSLRDSNLVTLLFKRWQPAIAILSVPPTLHNATLWAPGFMVDDVGDVIEMVTKWLSVPVATYLDAGSPSQDYTQSPSTFVKSLQGDIDVGAMFNNFRIHPSERHALGVRVINTAPQGEYEHHESWQFCALHFWRATFSLPCVSSPAHYS